MITAKIVADSINTSGNRMTTLELVFPRIILAELNTHRALSKNSASSRAIPFKKMVEMVKENPFIPLAFQEEHKGMQGNEYIANETGKGGDYSRIKVGWQNGIEDAIKNAEWMNSYGCTKQLCNRLLEPFMYHKVLISGTDWDNFFELRCPSYEIDLPLEFKAKTFRSRKDILKALIKGEYEHAYSTAKNYSEIDWLKLNKGQAEIHMMALAEAIWDAMNESTPKQLQVGEWHIPYEDKIEHNKLLESATTQDLMHSNETIHKIKVATGMAARASYTTVGDEKEVKYETLIGIHDKMKIQVPFHASPFEHCSQASEGRFYNLNGFKSYRYTLENA